MLEAARFPRHARKDDHRNFGGHAGHHVATRFSSEPEVDDRGVRRSLLQQRDGLRSRVGGHHLEVAAPQQMRERLAHALFIFDDEHERAAASHARGIGNGRGTLNQTVRLGYGKPGAHVAAPLCMGQRWLTGVGATLGLVSAFGLWMTSSAHVGTSPPGRDPEKPGQWRFTGPDAEALRHDALQRAIVRIDDSPDRLSLASDLTNSEHAADGTIPECRFFNDAPSGTTPKFHCVFPNGDTVKVKYGRNSEIHAEAAATRLVRSLGFAADEVTIVPRLRCYGCPRLPFETMTMLELVGLRQQLGRYGHDEGYTDFEWVSVERRFPAPAIKTDSKEGWAWWELETSTARRADLDALRLLAAFLEHWDNKSENQRLVCLDGEQHETNQHCNKPLAMIQDLGATFGPHKVNLAMWRHTPIWADAHACRVNVRTLPYQGATFPEIQISEEGREQLARRLAMLSDADIRSLFADARFPQFYSATPDERDLDAWVEAFRARVDQIVGAGPCPPGTSQRPIPNS